MKSYLVKGSALKYLKSTLPLKNLAVAYAAVRSLMMLTIHLKIHSYLNSGCVFFRDNLNSDYIHTYHPWSWCVQVPFHCSQKVQSISHDIKNFQIQVRVWESDSNELNYFCWIPNLPKWVKHVRKVILIIKLKIAHGKTEGWN